MNGFTRIGLLTLGTVWSTGVLALPVAQLDLAGDDVTWDPVTETVVTSDPTFTVYGYGNTPTGNGQALDLSLDWHLSVAVVPQTVVGTNIGSFTIDGVTYDSSDLLYGVPPLETWLEFQGQDLSQHGVYPTLFLELDANWLTSQTRAGVNVQNTPGTSPLANPGSDLYWLGWDINVAGLLDGFELHFDLYGSFCTTLLSGVQNCRVHQFAPFSHDAETTSVPEPATAMLLGAGLLLLGFGARRRSRGRATL